MSVRSRQRKAFWRRYFASPRAVTASTCLINFELCRFVFLRCSDRHCWMGDSGHMPFKKPAPAMVRFRKICGDPGSPGVISSSSSSSSSSRCLDSSCCRINICYLRQGGYVVMSVCLFVCKQNYAKLLSRFLQNSMKTWNMGQGRNVRFRW